MSSLNPIPRQIRRKDVVAAGGQKIFASADFKVYDPLDVRVRVRGITGRWVTQTSGFAITLAGEAPNVPVVTFAVGRAAGDGVRIEGSRVPSRTTDVTFGGAFRAGPLEAELDKNAVTLQEVRRDYSDVLGITEDLDSAIEDVALAAQAAASAAGQAEQSKVATQTLRDQADLLVKSVGINVLSYGADPTGALASDDAFEAACAAVRLLDAAPGVPASWRLAELIVPTGTYKITRPIQAVRKITSPGQARLVTTADISILDAGLITGVNPVGLTRLDVEGITFVGGRHHVAINNPNIDNSLFRFDRCHFYGSADYSTYLVNAYSAILRYDDCNWRNCNGEVHTESDLTIIDGGWSHPDASNFNNDRAVWNMAHADFYHQSFTVMGEWRGVPTLTGKSKVRWVNVRGAFNAIGAFFGGEDGGIPIAYHFTKANTNGYDLTGVPANYADPGLHRGGRIVLRDCWLYAGGTARADSCAVCLAGELPVSIVISGCTGPLAVPMVYNPPVGGVAGIPTYLANWRAATGRTDETKYFDWQIDDHGSRASQLVPDGCFHLMRRPSRVSFATAYLSANAAFPAGEIKAPLDAANDPRGMFWSAADNGFKLPADGVYLVTGNFYTSASTGANQVREAYIRNNGTRVVSGNRAISTAASQPLASNAAGLIYGAKGDIINLYGSNNGGSDTFVAGFLGGTNLSIVGPL